MTNLIDTIATTRVVPGTVHIWWLGGNGFVFKTSNGTRLYIDPYFSDAAETIFGLQRAFAPPISAEDADPDLVIATHWHEDHLDPGGLPIVANQSNTQFLAPPSCVSRLLSWMVPRERVTGISVGETKTFNDLRITAVPARHLAGLAGWETDDAIGALIEVDGLRVYHCGDTEYDLRLRALAFDHERPIDVCMLVINGTGGNMNAHEAALLAWQLGAKTIFPMHHRLWKNAGDSEQATLDPQLFIDTYRRLGGKGNVVLLDVGEGLLLRR